VISCLFSVTLVT